MSVRRNHSPALLADCPECESILRIHKKPRLGDTLVCRECGEKLEVVNLNPLELDWVYTNYDDEDGDWAEDLVPAFDY